MRVEAGGDHHDDGGGDRMARHHYCGDAECADCDHEGCDEHGPMPPGGEPDGPGGEHDVMGELAALGVHFYPPTTIIRRAQKIGLTPDQMTKIRQDLLGTQARAIDLFAKVEHAHLECPHVDVPAHFNEDRIDVLHDLMRGSGLATLVSMTADGLIASHAPALMLDPAPAPFGTLIGHLAKANPHARLADPGVQTLVIFQGPDGYITPSYYAAKKQHGKVVPTWNYAAIHAYGTLQVFDAPHQVAGSCHPPDQSPRSAPRVSLGCVRRTRRLHRGHAARHRRHRSPLLLGSRER